jgi:hypothetical protein
MAFPAPDGGPKRMATGATGHSDATCKSKRPANASRSQKQCTRGSSRCCGISISRRAGAMMTVVMTLKMMNTRHNSTFRIFTPWRVSWHSGRLPIPGRIVRQQGLRQRISQAQMPCQRRSTVSPASCPASSAVRVTGDSEPQQLSSA